MFGVRIVLPTNFQSVGEIKTAPMCYSLPGTYQKFVIALEELEAYGHGHTDVLVRKD